MVVSSPVGFELLGCFNVTASFEREGQPIGQPKGHVAVVSIPRNRVPTGGGPINLASPSTGDLDDAAAGDSDGGGTAMALLFVTKAGFTNAIAAAGTAFAINDMGRFRMKFIHEGKFSFEVRGEGPGGCTLVLCSVSSGQLIQDVRRLAQFISDVKVGKAPGMPHKCVACGLKDKADSDKKRKQEEALKEREAKKQRMEEEKKLKEEQKKREKEEREARQKQEKAMKEMQKKMSEMEKERDSTDRIRAALMKELKEKGEKVKELQEKLSAAARDERRKDEEVRRAREESAGKEAQWKAREAEIRRVMEEEFRVRREEEQRVRQAADMQRWAREQQMAKEVEEMRKKLQEEEGKRMFEAMSHREEMTKLRAEVDRMYQQQQSQQQGQQPDSFGPPPPPPPKEASAEALAKYSALLRDREARMRAAFNATQSEIRRNEAELRKKRTEEERRRKAEEAKKSKAETAKQRREEAAQAERMRAEEERRSAQAEEARKREEERKRMEELERERRAREEERRKAMAEDAALAAKQKWLEDETRRRQAAAPMAYEQYENRLRQIKNSAGSANVPLHFWDIPWPPEGNCLFLSPTDDAGMKKRKFKDALLFWHADKFIAFCGSRLVPEHKDVILMKVAKLSQEVVEARNHL